ncbi:MAG: Zn-ribbon domain-containing OB-fold protein [Dehalococcoidia bacterium]
MTTNPTPPIPVADDASAPFFAGAAAGRLMLMRCVACGTHRYPARDRCDVCWSTETEWVEASGRASLHSWVVFHQVYHLAFADRVPYNVAVVELEEGPRITTNVIDCELDDLKAGMALIVMFEEIAEGMAMAKFRPT